MLPYTGFSWADYLDEEAQEPHEKCGYCHEIDGNPLMARYPRLASQHPDYLVKQLEDFRAARRRGEMQGTAELLSDAEIQRVAQYFSQQAVEHLQLEPQQAEKQRLAKKLFEQGDPKRGLSACNSCHGTEGLGKAGIPRLASQHEAYLLQQLGQFKSGTRDNDANAQMRNVIAYLDETEITAMAAYLARMKPAETSSQSPFN